MARPALPEDQVQSAAIRLRMRPADLDVMRRAADRSGLSLSSWTRDRLLKVARQELGGKRR